MQWRAVGKLALLCLAAAVFGPGAWASGGRLEPALSFPSPVGCHDTFVVTLTLQPEGTAAGGFRFAAQVPPDFRVVSLTHNAGAGSYGPAGVNWVLDRPGSQPVVMQYQLQHQGEGEGNLRLHESASLAWTDGEGQARSAGFADRQVTVLTCKPDTTAPTLAIIPGGREGQNGWYLSPVDLELSATDPPDGTGVALLEYQIGGGPWQPYAGPVRLSDDGLHAVGVRAQDGAGNVAEEHATIRLDATPPRLAVVSPAAGAWYDGVSPLAVEVAAADDTAGMDGVEAALDGAPVAAGRAMAAALLAPGEHTLLVAVSDRAGNRTETAVTFTVGATYEGLLTRVAHLREMGLIDTEGIANSLQRKLEAAQEAHLRGSHEAEQGVLQAFVRQVAAQRGKHLEETAADLLLRDGQWLATRLDP